MVTSHQVRGKVDNWRFWMVLAYFGIVLALCGLLVVYLKANSEETKRVASTRATEIQAVTTCFAAVKNAPVVAGFLAGQNALIINGIDGNQAALKIKGQDPKLRAVREESLARLKIAQANVTTLATLIKGTTPTTDSCVDLAVKTHVPYQQFLRKH